MLGFSSIRRDTLISTETTENATENRSVGGSIPPLGTNKIKGLAGPSFAMETLICVSVDKAIQVPFCLRVGSTPVNRALACSGKLAPSE